jgi:hypothetical protein
MFELHPQLTFNKYTVRLFQRGFVASLALLFASLVLYTCPALADAPSRKDVREAKRHYNAAKRSLRRKEFLMALVHLKDAENKHPTYKYAAALASTHLKSRQGVLAWEALGRAEKYGVPKQKQREFDELSQSIERELLETHAFLELTVFPPNASVRIQKQQWLPPYQKWVPRSFSVLTLEAPAHAPMTVKWHHPRNNKSKKTIRMEPVTNFGYIEVRGEPLGASVSIDGKRLGTLPKVKSGILKPGTHTVTVEKAEFITVEREVIVSRDNTTEIEIILDPIESDLVKALKSKKVWGWTSVGVGGAAFITGIGLLAHSAVLISDVNELNRTHVSGYDDYLSKYDQAAQDIPTFGAAGWSLLSVGLALGATGAVLLVLDENESQPDTTDATPPKASPPPTIRISPGPMGASATVRF